MTNVDHKIELSAPIGDTVHQTTCYMCACRCGINVHMKADEDGVAKVRYIEGNRDHPVNKGVLCAKGSAGIMQHYSPARLEQPLLRTGPRGSGEFKKISWEEALTIASNWLGPLRNDPKKLAFFTGRDQSQSLTNFWAQQFGTPNYAAHGGFCSVNMAAAGIYTIGGAFWEFGSPDWDRTKLFLMFGVAEDHDSNPLKMGIGKLKKNGGRFVSVNPVRTGYSAIADNWLGITPGTDGLLVLALIHELFRTRKIDIDFLVRYSNAAWLVIDNPGAEDHGLFARDGKGVELVWDSKKNKAVGHTAKSVVPNLTQEVTLADGQKAKPVLRLMADMYCDEAYAPEAVAEQTGIAAETIRGLAAEIAKVAFEEEIIIDQPWTRHFGAQRHEQIIGRPVRCMPCAGFRRTPTVSRPVAPLHVLQFCWLGRRARRLPFKPPYPKPL